MRLLFVSLLFSARLLAGPDSLGFKNGAVIEYAAYRGNIVKIYPTFPEVEPSLLHELNIGFQARGKKPWHQLYHFPQPSLAMVYGYLGNDDVFGRVYGVVPNLTFNTNPFRKWGAQLSVGMGFSYFDNPYDLIDNPENNLVGSSITNMTFLKAHLWLRLAPSLALKAGYGAFHCSNGHYTLPNLGVNLPVYSLGVRYTPWKERGFRRFDSIPKPERKVRLNALLGAGRHEFGSSTKPTGGPKFMIWQGGVYASKRYRYINHVHAGMFVNYYTGFYDYTVNHEVFSERQHLRSTVVTLFLGHEFIIDRVGLVAQAGVNVYNPFFKEFKKIEKRPEDFELFSKTYIMNKLGIQYYFGDPTFSTRHKFFAGVYIKANFGQADFAEVATGFTF